MEISKLTLLFFQGRLTFLSHFKFYSNFDRHFVKIVTGTSCLFENFCLHISTSCIGFLESAQNVVYPCQERCTEYVCPSDCSSPCDIFYFILFNFLVWFIVSCLVWSGRVFSEWWTVKDLEGTSHDLINHCPSICLDKWRKQCKNH